MKSPKTRKPRSSGLAAEIGFAIGTRIRIERKAKRVSQERLAELIGMTFQQVQKYEKGSNRVSAEMLALIARALDVPVARFFADVPGIITGDHSARDELAPIVGDTLMHRLFAAARLLRADKPELVLRLAQVAESAAGVDEAPRHAGSSLTEICHAPSVVA